MSCGDRRVSRDDLQGSARNPYIRSVLSFVSNPRVVVVGCAAGLLSGVFGVGGGILLVPGLMWVVAMEQRRAHGTSLAAQMPIAATGLVTYLLYGNVDWLSAGSLVLGAIPGAVLGTRWLATINRRVLTWLFIAVAFASAIRLIAGDLQVGDGELSPTTALVLVGVGFASGVLAGLLGIGGGIVMVPALLLIAGLPAVVAKGTSLAVIVPTSIVGTWRNRAAANVEVRTAVTLGVAGAVFAVAGSTIADALPERAAAVSFAVLLALVSVRLAMRQKTS